MKKVLFTLVLLLVVPADVYGQTQKQAISLAEEIDRVNLELSTAGLNLSQMVPRLPSSELVEGAEIGNRADVIEVLFAQISVLARIYSVMETDRDRMFVRVYLFETAKQSTRTIERSLRSINQCLVGLRTPAAIAEAQKIRDAIQKLHSQIRATIPDS